MNAKTIEQARAAMLRSAGPLGIERVSLQDACGRCLAEDIVARRDQPPFRAASMDGYAARRSDLPGPLRFVGRSVAGARFAGVLGPGEAVRIFTGAPVPDDADVVVPQERAQMNGAEVTLEAGADSFVRAQGGDFPSGAALLKAGERLDPWRLALLAASGAADVAVARRPRLAILTTGDELAAAGDEAGPDQIFDSAGPAVAARAAALGAEIVGVAKLPDDLEATVDALRTDAVDLIVAIGGASVGDADHFRPAVRALSGSLLVEGVKVRPGRPTWFAHLPDGRSALGLPGNPSSALVCAELFLRPLLAALQGADTDLPLIQARLARAVVANGPREHWMRADVGFRNGSVLVDPDDDQESGWVRVFARAGALVRRPIDAEAAQAGDLVDALLLHRD